MNGENFSLEYMGQHLAVKRHSLGGQVIYRVMYEESKPPLVVTRALHAGGYKFWTSIPEGRQEEAEVIGALISEHLKAFQ